MKARLVAWGGLLVLVSAAVVALSAGRSAPAPTESAARFGNTLTAGTVTRPNPPDVYDPVKAGEPLPRGFRQLLARDQIAPVYDPVFIPASRADWPGEMLVIGVSGEQTAKAYPVPLLNHREMVIDSLEGIPILVTW